ncbi:MAG TPA: hypothetical protein VLE72_00165 [Candidatus Saccharimonadales bacterium]|nr:hypothetical protein [Candidatus Saccharimonadales bacterium]
MRFRLLALALLMSLPTLMFAASASANEPPPVTVDARVSLVRSNTQTMICPVAEPAICQGPTRGNNAAINVVVPNHFAHVSFVTLTFHFQGDLFDPGEMLAIMSGEGFANIDVVAQSDRVLTLEAFFQPADTAAFADGHQHFWVWMLRGSARLADIDASVTGFTS